jgi:lambda family phage minor tail protein L
MPSYLGGYAGGYLGGWAGFGGGGGGPTLTIQEVSQSLSPGARVELFELDLTKFGAGTLYFSTSPMPDGSNPFLGGQEYVVPAAPIMAEGFEKSGQGAPARPKLKIANGGNAASALLAQYNDLTGAVLRRIRTFDCFLDSGDSPDPDQILSPDVYIVSRKSGQNRVFVEFELRAGVDLDGVRIPKRQLVRSCQWRYRRPDPDNPGAFLYNDTSAACPYTGDASFDVFDQPCDAGSDRCSKQLSGCRKRFGQTAVLPFGGFPAAGRVQ